MATRTVNRSRRLRDAIRAQDAALGALIRSEAYEEAKAVFWQMHALSLDMARAKHIETTFKDELARLDRSTAH